MINIKISKAHLLVLVLGIKPTFKLQQTDEVIRNYGRFRPTVGWVWDELTIRRLDQPSLIYLYEILSGVRS